MTRILAIIGSPRKHGNTFKAVQGVQARMEALGPVTFEYLYLSEADVRPCRGCFTCLARGQALCPLEDDVPSIRERMHAADAVVLASPAYCQSVTGLMKNWIDRNAYLFHRPEFFHKQALLVVTSAGAGLKETADYLAMLHYWGFEIAGRLTLMSPPYPARPLAEEERRRKVEQAAQAFHTAILTQHEGPLTLNDLVHFEAIKGNSQFAPSYFPADWQYYEDRGLWSARYYYRRRMSWFKQRLTDLAIKMVGGSFEKRFVGQPEVTPRDS